jgi:hypothetical protein
MFASNEQDKTKPTAPDEELSEAWRSLLGLSGTAKETPVPPPAPTPAAGDPWGSLQQKQGMQAVDLQKAHLRERHPASGDQDIENALKLMSEEPVQDAKQPEKK